MIKSSIWLSVTNSKRNSRSKDKRKNKPRKYSTTYFFTIWSRSMPNHKNHRPTICSWICFQPFKVHTNLGNLLKLRHSHSFSSKTFSLIERSLSKLASWSNCFMDVKIFKPLLLNAYQDRKVKIWLRISDTSTSIRFWLWLIQGPNLLTLHLMSRRIKRLLQTSGRKHSSPTIHQN